MVTVSTFQIEIEVKDKGLLELKKIADNLGVEAASIDAAIERAKKRNPISIVAPGNNSTFSALAAVSSKQIGIAGLVLSALPILYNTIEFIINDLEDSNITLTEAEQKSIKNINDAGRVLEEAKKKKRSGVYSVSDEDLAKIIFGVENQRGVEINVKEFLDNLPGDDARFFDEERLKNINRLLENFRTVQDAAEKSTEKLNDTGIKNNEINEESIKLKKEDSQSLLNWDKNTTTAALSAKKHGEAIKLQADQLQRGNEMLELTDEDLLSLEGKYAALTNQSGFYTDALRQASGETADLVDKNKALVPAQEQINQVIDDGSAAMDNAGASAEQFGDTLEQVENSGGFFDGIKQGFIDFVDNVESNSELMADFFANTLTEMSQNFSDLFYNVLTGKFDNLQDLAKQTFEAILRAFLDMVSAIATRQIVISIAGAIGIGAKGASATDYLGLGKQAAGLGSDLGGLFGGGGSSAAAIGGGAAAIGGGISAVGAGASAAGGASSVGASLGLSGISSVGTVPTGGAATFGLGGISSIPAAGPGFLSAALPWVGAVLAAAAIAYTFLAPLLKKTPRLDIDFDSIKTEAGRRAAVVSEILDEDFFTEEIAQISVKRKAGLGVGGNDRIKEIIQEKLEETIEGIQDIIAKLPTDLFNQLNETLLNADIDIDTVIAGERLLEFDAKGKKIAEKFQAFIEGELPAKFFASIRESFFDPAFRALGVSAEGTEELIDDFMAKMEAAGSREARAEVGAEFIATFSAFVDAFNIVSGNVNDSIGQTIQNEEWEYRLAA